MAAYPLLRELIMRAFSKILTGSIVAGAALALSACGGKTETPADNTTITDLNSTDMMDGTMTDNMTAVDGAMGNDTMMMSNDTMMSNDSMMMSNEAGMTNAM
jgi:hypothetical protein